MEYPVIHYIIEGGFLIAMLSFLWKIGHESNQKINTVFRRFDEHKKEVTDTMSQNYVHKEIFNVQLDHANKDLARLERKVDDGFHNVDKKLDKLINGASHD